MYAQICPSFGERFIEQQYNTVASLYALKLRTTQLLCVICYQPIDVKLTTTNQSFPLCYPDLVTKVIPYQLCTTYFYTPLWPVHDMTFFKVLFFAYTVSQYYSGRCLPCRFDILVYQVLIIYWNLKFHWK